VRWVAESRSNRWQSAERALLEFGEQGVADARGPGGSTYDKIIDGQFAAAEGCRRDPPSGDAEAGAI
jgi:hypothetical protein